MSTPRYVGVHLREIRLACRVCGVLVYDLDTHNAFHYRLNARVDAIARMHETLTELFGESL